MNDNTGLDDSNNNIIDEGRFKIYKQNNKNYFWYKFDISQSLLSWYEKQEDESATSFILIHQITTIEPIENINSNDDHPFLVEIYLSEPTDDGDSKITFTFKYFEERNRFIQSLQKCKSFKIEINSKNVTNINQKLSTSPPSTSTTTTTTKKSNSFIGTNRKSLTSANGFSQVKHPSERSINQTFLMGTSKSPNINKSSSTNEETTEEKEEEEEVVVEEEDSIESMGQIQEEINKMSLKQQEEKEKEVELPVKQVESLKNSLDHNEQIPSNTTTNTTTIKEIDESSITTTVVAQETTVKSLKVINYREIGYSEDDNVIVSEKKKIPFRSPQLNSSAGRVFNSISNSNSSDNIDNSNLFGYGNANSLNNSSNSSPTTFLSGSGSTIKFIQMDSNGYYIIGNNINQLRTIIGRSVAGDTSFAGIIAGKFKIDWKPFQQIWEINLQGVLNNSNNNNSPITLNKSDNSIDSSSSSSNDEIEIGPATPSKEELIKRLEKKREKAIQDNDHIKANLLKQRQIELERSQEETFIFKGGIVLSYRNDKWELLEAPIPKNSSKTPYHQDYNRQTTTTTNSNIETQSMSSSVFDSISKVFNTVSSVVEPKIDKLIDSSTNILLNNNNNNNNNNQGYINQTPIEELNLSINQVQEIYIKPLKKAVFDITNYFSQNNNHTKLEQYSLGDDSINKRIAILVRGRLSTAIANLVSHGFIINPTGMVSSLFRSVSDTIGVTNNINKRHLWEFIENYKKTTQHGTIAGISLIQTINSINSFENLSTDWKDPNIKFRTFICIGLNQHLLDQWFALLQTDTNGISHYFYPNAIINSLEYWRLFCQCLSPIVNFPFKLSIDYEVKFLNSPQINHNTSSSTSASPFLSSISTPNVENIKNSINSFSNTLIDGTSKYISELSENANISNLTQSIHSNFSNLTNSMFVKSDTDNQQPQPQKRHVSFSDDCNGGDDDQQQNGNVLNRIQSSIKLSSQKIGEFFDGY